MSHEAITFRVGRDGVVARADERDAAGGSKPNDLTGRRLSELIEQSGHALGDLLAIASGPDEPVTFRFEPELHGDGSRPEKTLLRIATEVARAGAGNIDDAVVNALGIIGRLANADRGYVFIRSEDGRTIRNTHEWTRAGIEPQIVSLQGVPTSQFRWFERALEQNGYILIGSLDEVPHDATDARRIFEEGEISSLLCIGAFENEQLSGFVGFDSVRGKTDWSEEAVERLTLISELFIQSIQRARTERELIGTSDVFRMIRIATGDVIWDYDLESGTTTRKGALEELTGFEPTPENSNLEWWLDLVHPGDREDAAAALAQNNRNVVQCEYRIRHREGHWVHVLDRWHVIRDDEGRAVRMVGMATDITDRVRTVERLRESEARFRAVVDNISDLIVIINPDETIRWASAATTKMLGMTTEELTGMSVFNRVHPDDRPAARETFESLASTAGSREQLTVRLKGAQGNWVAAETNAINMLDDPSIEGLVLVSRDITSRLLIERQLERTNRLASLGRFSSAIAHEFNNTMMGIRPIVDLIRRSDDLDQIKAAVDTIEDALERGRSISRGVLKLSRPFGVALETFEIQPWLKSVEKEIRQLLPSRVSLGIETPKHPVMVIADPAALEESLLHLLLRARDARQDELGSIEITVRALGKKHEFNRYLGDQQHGFILLAIRDDGPELAAEEQEHLFDPKLATISGSSRGLGLSVAHQLITAQKGVIAVESERTGTTILIFLRNAESDRIAEEPIPDHTPAEVRETHDTAAILLVEDDEIVASGMTALLELEGQAVERASTGSEAIGRIARELPDLLILDIGLPDMTGIELFEKIETEHPDLPVIFSSGHGDQSEISHYIERPNVEFLMKPYDAATLLSVVQKLLADRHEA